MTDRRGESMGPSLLFTDAASALTGARLSRCPDRARRPFLGSLPDTGMRVLASLPSSIGVPLFLTGLVQRTLSHLHAPMGPVAFLRGIFLLCAPTWQVPSVSAWRHEGGSTRTLNPYGLLCLILAGHIGSGAVFPRG